MVFSNPLLCFESWHNSCFHLENLKGLHDERERREKGEHKLGRETELKLSVLTNEDQASLNRQKRNLE